MKNINKIIITVGLFMIILPCVLLVFFKVNRYYSYDTINFLKKSYLMSSIPDDYLIDNGYSIEWLDERNKQATKEIVNPGGQSRQSMRIVISFNYPFPYTEGDEVPEDPKDNTVTVDNDLSMVFPYYLIGHKVLMHDNACRFEVEITTYDSVWHSIEADYIQEEIDILSEYSTTLDEYEKTATGEESEG